MESGALGSGLIKPAAPASKKSGGIPRARRGRLLVGMGVIGHLAFDAGGNGMQFDRFTISLLISNPRVLLLDEQAAESAGALAMSTTA